MKTPQNSRADYLQDMVQKGVVPGGEEAPFIADVIDEVDDNDDLQGVGVGGLASASSSASGFPKVLI